MEQLKPILAHKFWILCGLAVVLPLAGWWLGTGNLKAETEKQIQTINSAESGIPGGRVPNEDYKKGISANIVVQKGLHREKGKDMWERQNEIMQWPTAVADYLKSLDYRAEGQGKKGTNTLVTYTNEYYADTLKQLHQLVNPVRRNAAGKVVGRVWLSADDSQGVSGFAAQLRAVLPNLVPYDQWSTKLPVWKEVWDAQEDIWLLRELLTAIDQVNSEAANAKTMKESAVKEIKEIILVGGSRQPEGQTQAASSSGSSSDAQQGAAESSRRGASGSSTDGASGAQGNGDSDPDFKIAEEVGPPEIDPDAATASSSASSSSAGQNSGSGAPALSASGVGGGGGPTQSSQGGGSTATGPLSRYVDKDPKQPFKTRAFKMKLIMRVGYLPQLEQQLSKMKFPVQILRVHWAAVDSDPMGQSIVGGSRSGADNGSASPSSSSPLGRRSSSGGPGSSAPSVRAALGSGRRSNTPGSATGGRDSSSSGTNATADSVLKQIYDQAMDDKELVQVVIGGLMTIYQPPGQEPETPQPSQGTDPSQPGQPQTGQPAGTQPGTVEKPGKTQPATSRPAAKTPAKTQPAGKTAPASGARPMKTAPASSPAGKTPAAEPAAPGKAAPALSGQKAS